jgi:hypothetical protein
MKNNQENGREILDIENGIEEIWQDFMKHWIKISHTFAYIVVLSRNGAFRVNHLRHFDWLKSKNALEIYTKEKDVVSKFASAQKALSSEYVMFAAAESMKSIVDEELKQANLEKITNDEIMELLKIVSRT